MSKEVEIVSKQLIAAPPAVVYRFVSELDHLRFVCPRRRIEWCPVLGVKATLGAEFEVRVNQGRHHFKIRFRTVRAEPGTALENEFITWPIRGARHLRTLRPEDGGEKTILTDRNAWAPPWFARSIVEKNMEEQQSFFDERMENIRRVVEAVYALRGQEAFLHGILPDAEAAKIEAIVPVGHEPA